MNAGEDKTFKDLEWQGRYLKNCEIAYKDKSDSNRLYVIKGVNTFEAYAVGLSSYPPCDQPNKSPWENDGLEVNTIFEITAYYDGVRHLHWNCNDEETDGYLYYPNMPLLIELLQKIRELELEICSDVDWIRA